MLVPFQDCEAGGPVLPADIYGSAHLLRLMVKIGGYLSFSNYTQHSCKVGSFVVKLWRKITFIQVIEDSLDDFLTYLDMNRSMFFTSKNYIPATNEYLTKVGYKN